MVLSDILKVMVHRDASDLFVTAGVAPSCKIDGSMVQLVQQPLTPEQSRDLAYSIMNEKQRKEFEATKECNFAIYPSEIGRFRVNVFVQQGRVGMVLRRINMEIPTFEELYLPEVLSELSMTQRGLLIFVGGTGSGKSTSQAAMIGYRNEHSRGHIITVEDPIEYVHEHNNCIVNQREVGVDTESFESALVNAMRQAPDVIQIGEIRTRETMDNAIVFSETGHMCLATLHANNTNQALDRIINFFPEERRNQLLMDLSMNLRGLVSQRLLPIKDGNGRVPAVEVLINTPHISDLILRNKLHEIKDAVKSSTEHGMQTFDQSLFQLHEDNLITYEEAMRAADSQNDLRLAIKLHGSDAHSTEFGETLANLTVQNG